MNWTFHRGRVTWKHNLIRQITLLWLVYAQLWSPFSVKYGEFGSIFWEFWVRFLKCQGTPYVWPNRKCLTTSRRVKNFKIFQFSRWRLFEKCLKSFWHIFWVIFTIQFRAIHFRLHLVLDLEFPRWGNF